MCVVDSTPSASITCLTVRASTRPSNTLAFRIALAYMSREKTHITLLEHCVDPAERGSTDSVTDMADLLTAKIIEAAEQHGESAEWLRQSRWTIIVEDEKLGLVLAIHSGSEEPVFGWSTE